MSNKILIIGGSGFLGSRFIEIASQNFELLNLDKRQSQLYSDITIIGDIRKPESIDDAFIDVSTVVLLAAEHRDDVSPSSLYYDVNVEGTKNVLNLMEKHGIDHLIFTSSVAVYGLNKPNPDENFPPDPFNHYGKSKWLAEELIRDWYNSDPLKKSLSIIRPTVIFGERNRGNVFNLLKQIASGNFLIVGNGKNKKSMAYVGNIAAFIIYLIENQQSGNKVFNYVDKPDLNMQELVSQVEKSLGKKLPSIRIPYFIGMAGGYLFDIFSKVTGKKLPISSVRIKKFCATTQFDAQSAQNSGFVAPYSLGEGLSRTIKFEFTQEPKDDIVYRTE